MVFYTNYFQKFIQESHKYGKFLEDTVQDRILYPYEVLYMYVMSNLQCSVFVTSLICAGSTKRHQPCWSSDRLNHNQNYKSFH